MNMARFKTVNDDFIDKSIYFMEKRINELTTWTSEIPRRGHVQSITSLNNTWKEPKLWEIEKYKEYNSWEITLVTYQRSVEKLIDELEKINQSNYSTITNKVALKADLMRHKDKLRETISGNSIRSMSIYEKRYLLNLVDRMFDDILIGLNVPIADYWNIHYEVNNMPMNGIYEVYINKKDVKDFNSEDIKIEAGGKILSPQTLDGEWIRFDNVTVKEKTSFPISLVLHKFPNLTGQTKWSTVEQTDALVANNEFGKNLVTLKINNNFSGDSRGLVHDIGQWIGNSIYVISFDYLTYSQNFSVTLYEKGGTNNNQDVDGTYNEILWSKEWSKFNAVVLSKEDAQAALLQITKDINDIPDQNNTGKVDKIEIKNLSVVRVPDPQIILKKATVSKESSIPQIIFTKINPTKYKVIVRGAKDPYTLVLSQEFNTKWKVFLSNEINESKTLEGKLSRIFGKFLESIMRFGNIVIASEENRGNLTRYFNDDITEGMHKNIFLDENTLETFGQDSIADKTHFLANEYANAWYISPRDVGNKENYVLIIEMTSQKLFYVSLIISLGGLLLLFFLLLKSFIRK